MFTGDIFINYSVHVSKNSPEFCRLFLSSPDNVNDCLTSLTIIMLRNPDCKVILWCRCRGIFNWRAGGRFPDWSVIEGNCCQFPNFCIWTQSIHSTPSLHLIWRREHQIKIEVSMFFKLEMFDRIIIHKVVALAFLLYEDLCRSWRVLLLLNDQKAWNI